MRKIGDKFDGLDHGNDILELTNCQRRRLRQNEKKEQINLMSQMSNVSLIDGVEDVPG